MHLAGPSRDANSANDRTTTECRVLVVDDDEECVLAVADLLGGNGMRCELASSGDAALEACRQHSFDAVVSDIRMPGMDGVELMTRVRRLHPSLPVVLMTAQGSIGAAVEAVKRGAFQYLLKPFDGNVLRGLVDEAVAQNRAPHPDSPSSTALGMSELIGGSSAMTRLRDKIELVAAATSPVLIVGETGTGKELVAHAIHRCSARAGRPFVTVNAAAVPEALLESEMFGHVRGAFTGATQTHRGLFSEASGGTLFLDEIGDMPLGLQAKLLRVLQSGELRAVGSGRLDNVDVRVIAATHRHLPDLVAKGGFRDDLYYRLNVININVPPLRARRSDIARLATTFVARARERAPQSRVTSLSDDLLALLAAGRWPGNVRELQGTIERLVVLAGAEVVEPHHLALVDAELVQADEGLSSAGPVTTGPGHPHGSIDDLVREHVERVLAHTDGHKARAAKILGVDLSTMYRWQQKWRP
jgi:two-component system response regulator HydG